MSAGQTQPLGSLHRALAQEGEGSRALPAALEGWRGQLEGLCDEWVAELGGWVSRLALAVGPLKAARREDDGEPDGYRGLSRRGGYERLLLSEWALAEAMPEEFVRRAAMKEHAFYELARVEEGSGRRCFVLFDAGPGQLGSPRLAQMAWLVVLARRAEAAGVELRWGVLQDPGRLLLSGFQAAAVRHLLEMRQRCGPAQGALEGWQAQGLAELEEGDELWWVGDAEWQEAARLRRGWRVALRELEEPGVSALEVKITPPTGGAARHARLELPSPEARVRLLTNPLAPPPKRKGPTVARPLEVGRVPILRGSNLAFSGDGRRVFVRTEGGGVAALHVPHSPREQAGLTRYATLGPGERLVAVAWHERRVVLVAAAPSGDLALEGLYPGHQGKVHRVHVPAAVGGGLVGEEEDGPVRPCLVFKTGRGPELVLVDRHQRLYKIAPWKTGPMVECLAHHVCALRALRRGQGSFAYATTAQSEGQPRMRLWAQEGTQPSSEELPGSYAVMLGYSAQTLERGVGLWASREGALRWTLGGAGPSRERHGCMLHPGATVVGVIGAGPGLPWMVVLSLDRRSLHLVSPNARRQVVEAPSPLLRVCVSQHSPHIAWLQASGRLGVYSLAHEGLVLDQQVAEWTTPLKMPTPDPLQDDTPQTPLLFWDEAEVMT